MNPSRATIPLIRPHQCDSEGGRIRGVLLYNVVLILPSVIPNDYFWIGGEFADGTRHDDCSRRDWSFPKIIGDYSWPVTPL